MTPKILYKLNKVLDKNMALAFLGIKAGGIDFSNGIVNVHPELKGINRQSKVKQQETINSHFDNFYKEHNEYLNKRVDEFQKDWDKLEKKYFQAVAKIFKNYSWSKGKYIGYLSIIDCNPRFLNNKTFQVFYFHPEGVVSVTAHELLHFMFYDYCIKKHSKIFKKLNTDNGIFWDLAEIFNAVILAQPEFVKIHKIKKQANYPVHKKYIPILKRLWTKEQDIDKWIVKSFDYLKNEK
ncbi:hypothetical protein KKC16_02075 [Patescibacteria group bacterium]|nr:hypothetical protein [Patescibacteria group bacterium]MBU4482217.1 hypothetical protein [Patescibacteria group bacterium]